MTPEDEHKLLNALAILRPFTIVTGDVGKRLQPHLSVNLNSTCFWAVTNGQRSGHIVRKAIQDIDDVLATNGKASDNYDGKFS